MRESKIEREVVKYAERNGWLAIKLNSGGNRGKPDRLFLKDGRTVFIEFKATGKPLQKLQKYWKEQIEARGHTVHVVDNRADGLRVLGE